MSSKNHIGFSVESAEVKDYIQLKAKKEGLQHGSQLVKTIVYRHLKKYDKEFVELLDKTLCCEGSIS